MFARTQYVHFLASEGPRVDLSSRQRPRRVRHQFELAHVEVLDSWAASDSIFHSRWRTSPLSLSCSIIDDFIALLELVAIRFIE